MSRESKFLKNTIIYAVGNFGSKLLGFLLLPLYTHFLNKDQMGYYDLISTTVSLLLPLITLQINDGMYRYVLEAKDEKKREAYINNSILVTIKGILIFSLIFLGVSFFIKIQYSLLIFIQVTVTVISTLFMQISRGYQRNLIYSVSGIIMTFTMLVSNIIFLNFTTLLVEGLIISNIIGSVIVIIYIEAKLKIIRRFSLKGNNQRVTSQLLAYSIPLIPVGISWWVMNLADRLLLKHFLGNEAVGIYAVSNKFPAILMIVNSLFYLSWQETSIVEYEAKDRDAFYTRMFNTYMVIQFTSVIGLIAFSKLALKILVSEPFFIAWQYTPFLYIGAMFSAFSSFYGTGYQSSKNTRGAFTTSVIGAVVNLTINIIIIPYIGLQGAAISTAASFFIMWALRLVGTKEYFRIHLNKKLLSALSILLIVEVALFYLNNFIADLVIQLASIIIFIIFNFKLINQMISIVRSKLNAKTGS
jgi:O-antigen/teichoic acid export membrane protein